MSTPYLEIAPPEVGFDAGVACVVPVETSVGLVAPETEDVPDDLAGVAIPGFVGLAVGWEISLGVLLWEKANDQMEKRYWLKSSQQSIHAFTWNLRHILTRRSDQS